MKAYSKENVPHENGARKILHKIVPEQKFRAVNRSAAMACERYTHVVGHHVLGYVTVCGV